MDPPSLLMSLASGLLLATGVLTAFTAVAQPVYRWTDASGEVHFSDRPPAGAVQHPLEQVEVAPLPAAPQTDDYYSVVNQARRMEEQRLERERQAAEIEVLQRQAAPPEPVQPARPADQGVSHGIWIAPPVYWGPGTWPGHRPPHRPGWEYPERPYPGPGHRPPPDRPRPKPERPSFSVDTQRR